jgi:hypothetical protein
LQVEPLKFVDLTPDVPLGRLRAEMRKAGKSKEKMEMRIPTIILRKATTVCMLPPIVRVASSLVTFGCPFSALFQVRK